jgi:hypothetical protein
VKSNKPVKPWKPRQRVPFNTGTRPHDSKRTYKRVKRVDFCIALACVAAFAPLKHKVYAQEAQTGEQRLNTRADIIEDEGYEYGKASPQVVDTDQAIAQDWRTAAVEPTWKEEDRKDKEAFRVGWLQGYAATHNHLLPWD